MAQIEQTIATFITRLRFADVPPQAQRVVRQVVLAVCGTGIAGAREDGIQALRGLLLQAGGAPQATLFVYGDKLPAAAAAQFNGTLCRALDFCDAMAPGPHFGAALFPAALAAAELAGGCSGAEFMAALVAGLEVGSRFNLTEAQYDGFDPTGIAALFAATAAVARILKLDDVQTVNALGLAFNRCGGSFQNNVDGSLGVRMVQGWVAQAAVHCAQLAQIGITGPANFLTGHYGFAHLYGRDTLDTTHMVAGLGEEWRLQRVIFKKYPSCGVTQGVTELALALVQDIGLQGTDVLHAEVRLPPYAHRLVGHVFQIGANPRVDAQFSAAWCVANALMRQSSQLQHFTPARVRDAGVCELAARVRVVADPAMDPRGHTAVNLTVTTRDGQTHQRQLDIAPGFPGAALNDAQHLARYHDCMAYAPVPLATAMSEQLMGALNAIDELADARMLATCLVAR